MNDEDKLCGNVLKNVTFLECESIDLTDKDIITLKNFRDFKEVMDVPTIILKLKDAYYLLSRDVAYIYIQKKGE